MRTKTKISLGISTVGVLIVALIICLSLWQEKNQVPVLAEYPDKVVYTTDLSVETSFLIQDCAVREGKFNTCGTPCAPDEAVCTAVCAYTCDFK